MTNAFSRPPGSLGAHVRLHDLSRDPYPIFERLRIAEPVSWIDELQMWYVTRYRDVQAVLGDPVRFTTRFESSTIFDTFGAHMLTSDGAEQRRYRDPFRGAFTPAAVRRNMEGRVRELAGSLIQGFAARSSAELRADFAARLPILSILAVFGLPAAEEPLLRRWYDTFEQALANFRGDPAIRAAARTDVAALHELLQQHIGAVAGNEGGDLLAQVANRPAVERLSDAEIKRNASIIFFGGISTVEALILNCLYALFTHRAVLERVKSNPALIPALLEEVMRWLSPVQSAMRHATTDVVLHGVQIRAGDTVSCMLGAANRDPAMFPDPDRFDIDRPNSRKHLGFAFGSHACLGSHLAKLEARVALETLLLGLTDLEPAPDEPMTVEGYEFRQPKRLLARWHVK
ncbi:MAG: cytochrome P450 [Steroidobacteraceae bacterium]